MLKRLFNCFIIPLGLFFNCYPAIPVLEALSKFCLSITSRENLYPLNTHHTPSFRPVMSDPPRRKQRGVQEVRQAPYSLRSKTAPQEAAARVEPDLQAETSPIPSWEQSGMDVGGASPAPLCTCTESGCQLNHHVAATLRAGPSVASPATHSAKGENPLRPAQPSTPNPVPTVATSPVDQAQKATSFYQSMLAAGVADVNSGKTEDEVVADQLQRQAQPAQGQTSGMETGVSAFAGAALGGAVGMGLAALSNPSLPTISLSPSLGGLNLNSSGSVNVAVSPTPSTTSLPTSSASGGSDRLISVSSEDAMDADPAIEPTPTPLVPSTPAPPTQLRPTSRADATTTTTPMARNLLHPTAEVTTQTSPQVARPPTPPKNSLPLQPDPSINERIVVTTSARGVHRGQAHRGTALTKIGDHSVHGTDVYEYLLHSQAPLPHSEANYIRVLWSRIRDADEQFAYADQAVSITSYINPSAPGGGVDAAVAITNRVLRYHQAPIAQNARRTLDITWCEGFTKSGLPMSEIMKFFVGGTISERAVTSAILPKLQPANHNTLRNLSNYLVESVNSIDNFGMYAKLLWSAFVRDQYTYAGVNPIATAFDAADAVHYVNLDDPNLDYNTITTPILRGDIILVGRADYDPNDAMAIQYLAQAGRRYDSGVNDVIPHTAYVRWPAIKVTILGHGAAPAQPQAAVLSSEALMAFATKLAQQRNEMAQLVEGLYWVMDHAGVRYSVVADHPQAQYILPDFRITDVQVPRPQDYNVLLRLAGVRPLANSNDGAEVMQYSTIRSQDRVRLVALYTAAYSTFATTVLHSIQLAGARLREWYGGFVIAPAATQLLTTLNNITQPTANGAEAPIFNIIKDCFPKFLNVDVVRGTHKGNMWLGSYGSQPQFAAAFEGVPLDTTPRIYNPLIIDNFLTVRPREWGIVGPCPKVDVHREIILQAQLANQGWRALRGSEDYQKAAVGASPFNYVEYGAFAVNAIVQYLRPDAQLLSIQDAYYSPGGVAEFAPPVPYAGPQYIAALHTFMPCTIMTWDSANLTVRAIAISQANLPHQDMLALTMLKGQELQSAGLVLSSVNHGGGTYQLPTMFTLPLMLNQPEAGASGADTQPPPAEN